MEHQSWCDVFARTLWNIKYKHNINILKIAHHSSNYNKTSGKFKTQCLKGKSIIEHKTTRAKKTERAKKPSFKAEFKEYFELMQVISIFKLLNKFFKI